MSRWKAPKYERVREVTRAAVADGCPNPECANTEVPTHTVESLFDPDEFVAFYDCHDCLWQWERTYRMKPKKRRT